MRVRMMVLFGLLALCLAGSSAWAQYDMRNPNNPYAGMGRTGFALEDRSKALQEQKAAQKAKQNAGKQNSQNQQSQSKKQQNKK